MEVWNTVMIGCFVFICIVGTLGNILVIATLRFVKMDTHNSCLTPMDHCICYLAVIDLLTSLINPMMFIYYEAFNYREWIFGETLCVIMGSLTSVFDTMSLGMILVITIERCIVLCFPFRKNLCNKEIRFALICVVIVSVLNELPHILNLHQRIHSTVQYSCNLPKMNSTSCNVDIDNIHHEDKTLTYENHTIFKKFDMYYLSCDKLSYNELLSNIVAKSLYYNCGSENMTLLNIIVNKSQVQCTLNTCHKVMQYCSPKDTIEYKYSRLATLMLRDVMFIIVFTTSLCFIHKSLTKHERLMHGQSNTKSKKCFTFLLTMAIVFCLLVFPKDIFQMIYLMLQLLRKKLGFDGSLQVNSVLKLLQSCNSIANVFIYARLHSRFRQKFRRKFTALSKQISSFSWSIPAWFHENQLARMKETAL